MAASQLVSSREYLAGVYEPDAELVDGVIEERAAGEKDHSKWQLAIQLWFILREDEWSLRVYPSVRVQTSESNFRVPDVLVLEAGAPDEQVITHPPLAVFEILSPEDRVQRVMRKLVDYEAMGIAGIYLVDPRTGAFQRFRGGDLMVVRECTVGAHTFATGEVAKLVR